MGSLAKGGQQMVGQAVQLKREIIIIIIIIMIQTSEAAQIREVMEKSASTLDRAA